MILVKLRNGLGVKYSYFRHWGTSYDGTQVCEIKYFLMNIDFNNLNVYDFFSGPMAI